MPASFRRRAVSVLVMTAVGCAGRYGGSPTEPARLSGGIEAAALPYQVVDARTGKSIDEPAFWARLTGSQAVCVGEEHPNPHHHWVQLHVVRELIKRLPRGTRLALAMEMFQRPFQGVLDDYATRRIDAATLRSRSGYQERWGYDYAFYGPTIDAAVGAGAQLLAANAPKELTRKVARHGLESLTSDERAQVPELKLDDAAHRSWFDALMDEMDGAAAHSRTKAKSSDDARPKTDAEKPAHARTDAEKPAHARTDAEKPAHPRTDAEKPAHARTEAAKPEAAKPEAAKPARPPPAEDPAAEPPSAERVYTVQVLWDETMADTAARWLAANPGGHLILLAGNGHCHDSGIVNRIKRRGIAGAVSIRGVIEDGEGSVGEALAKPMNDFVVVLQMPAGVERKPADR